MPTNRRLAAILFADITGYTAMMQRDEEDGMRRLHRFREVLEERVAAHGGRVLQHIGDGSLVIFDSAVEAVSAAQEIQIMLQVNPKVPARIGIHLGDVVMDGGQVYGDGVNLASRVESLGAPGSVLVTGRLIPDLKSHPEFEPKYLGRFALKNVAEPVEVYAMKGDGLYVPAAGDLSEVPLENRQRRLRTGWLVALGLALILGAALFLGLPALQKSGNEKAPPRSIAVLPFEDLSSGGSDTYFADGIAEEIGNALAKVPELKVAGRTSAAAFRSSELPLDQIGRRLHVGSLLEGSVRRQGDRVRISAQLISTEDGYELWSERYDRELDDIFAIQDEIARAVADELSVLLRSEGVRQGTDSQEAYEWYLRGRHHLSQRSDGINEAKAAFQRALSADSAFANAYAGLGHCYLWMGWNNFLPSREAFPEARELAEEALQRDSSLAYAYAMLGSVHLWYEWDWEEAEQYLQKALEKNPSEAAAYLDLGWIALIHGRYGQAVSMARRALSIDPLNLEYSIDLADFYRMSGQLQEAERLAQEMFAVYPANSEVHWILGNIDYAKGAPEAAVAHFRRAAELSSGESWSNMYLAMALARSGEQTEARALLARLEQQPEVAQSAFAELAPVYWELGMEQEAMDWLERAYDWHANWMISLQVDPIWTDMRTHPRFQALLQKMNFEQPAF